MIKYVSLKVLYQNRSVRFETSKIKLIEREKEGFFLAIISMHRLPKGRSEVVGRRSALGGGGGSGG